MFAPPAIALAIGAYLNVQFPAFDPKLAALCAYVIFTTLNIAGVQIAATFELFVTLLAVGELLVFMGVVAPALSWSNFAARGWSGSSTFSISSIGGIFAAIPVAIWFFLLIEGVAMAAEEARDPKRLSPRFRTPHFATIAGGLIGVAAIYSDSLINISGQSLTASIVTMSVFGAIVMYLMSMASLFRLRRIEPNLERPYLAPFYPIAPAFALIMAAVALTAMIYYNPVIFLIFAGIMAVAVGVGVMVQPSAADAPVEPETL